MPDGSKPAYYVDDFGFKRATCDCRCLAQVECDLEEAKHRRWTSDFGPDWRDGPGYWSRRIEELEEERGRLLAGRTGAALGDLVFGL